MERNSIMFIIWNYCNRLKSALRIVSMFFIMRNWQFDDDEKKKIQDGCELKRTCFSSFSYFFLSFVENLNFLQFVLGLVFAIFFFSFMFFFMPAEVKKMSEKGTRRMKKNKEKFTHISIRTSSSFSNDYYLCFYVP